MTDDRIETVDAPEGERYEVRACGEHAVPARAFVRDRIDRHPDHADLVTDA